MKDASGSLWTEQLLPRLLENKDDLLVLSGAVFKEVKSDLKTPADRVVLALCWSAAEDFSEILALAERAHGIGALKLLRGMYERLVTAAFILKNPGDAQDFLAYYHVHRWKLLNHVSRHKELNERLDPETKKHIETQYESVKARFVDVVCKQCGKKSVRSSWTKLDTFSLALKAGGDLADLYWNCFYLPTQSLHATVPALLERIEVVGSTVRLGTKPQINHAETALVYGQMLYVLILETVCSHFSIERKDDIEKAKERFRQLVLDLQELRQTDGSAEEAANEGRPAGEGTESGRSSSSDKEKARRITVTFKAAGPITRSTVGSGAGDPDGQALDDLLHWIWSWRTQVNRLVASTAAQGRGDGLESRRSSSLTTFDEHMLVVAGGHLARAVQNAADRFGTVGLVGDKSEALRLLRNLYEHWDEQRESFQSDSVPKSKSGKEFVQKFPKGKPRSISYAAEDWLLGGVVPLKALTEELVEIEKMALKRESEL